MLIKDESFIEVIVGYINIFEQLAKTKLRWYSKKFSNTEMDVSRYTYAKNMYNIVKAKFKKVIVQC